MSLSPQEIVIPSPFPSPKTTNVQQSPTTLTTTQPPPPPPPPSSSSSSTTTAGSSPSKKKEKKEKKKDTHRSPLISLLDLLDKPRHHGKLSRSASSTDFRESIVISRTDSHDGFNEAPPSASMTSSILDPALPPPIHPTRDTPTTATTKGGADKHPTTPTKQPYVTALDQDALALSNLNRGGGGASIYAITSPRHRKPIRETKETLSPFLSAVSNPLNHSGGKPGAKMHNNNNNNIGTSATILELAQDDIIGTEGADNITINGSNGLGKNSEESALFGLEKSAALQESAFCNVLDLLLNGYMEPIRAQIDADYANDPVMHGELIVDMSPIFDGLANLYRSAVVQSEKLVDLVKRGVHFWIAKAYADFDDYVAAYRSFLNAHRRAIKKLASLKAVNSPLSGYVKSAGETLAKLNKSQYAGRVLEDLLRFCVARLSHLSNLAKAQYSIATSLRIARETCIISDFFSITCRHTFDQTSILKIANSAAGPSSNPLDSIDGVDEAFSVIHDMETTAGKLCEIHTRRDMETSINATDDRIPLNIERVYRGKIRATLVESSEFGLSLERPIWLAFFSDALAVLSLDKRTRQDARPSYDLIRWAPHDALSIHPLPEVSATPTCNLRRNLYKLALRSTSTTTNTSTTINTNSNNSTTTNPNNNSMNSSNAVPATPPLTASSGSPGLGTSGSFGGGIPLPPGWEIGTGKGKQRVYTYGPDGTTQGAEPRMAPELVKELLVAVPTDAPGAWEEWVARHQHQQAQGNAWDDRPDLYRQIGSSLEEILGYEQAFYPGESTPLLFRILTNALLRKGLGDEGIFRINWDTNENAKLIASINSGRATCAGIRKTKAAKKRWWHGSSDSDSSEALLPSSQSSSSTQPSSSSTTTPASSTATSSTSSSSSNTISGSSGANSNANNSSGTNASGSGLSSSASSLPGDEIDFSTCHPHAIANLLKAFFRCMPTPVIPAPFYRRFHALVAEDGKGGKDKDKSRSRSSSRDDEGGEEGGAEGGASVDVLDKVEAFRSLVNELPEANYVLLRDLMQFLHTVSCSSKANHMPARNLAIVFAVNLMWESEESKTRPLEILESNKVIMFLIEHSPEIFGEYLNPGDVPTLTAATVTQIQPPTAPFVHLRHKVMSRRVPIAHLLPPLSRSSSHSRKPSPVTLNPPPSPLPPSQTLTTNTNTTNTTITAATQGSGTGLGLSSPLSMPADDVSEGPWTLATDGMMTSWSRSSFKALSETPTTLSEPRIVAAVGRTLWAALPKGGIVVLTRGGSGAAPTVVHTPGPVTCIAATGDGTVWCGCEGCGGSTGSSGVIAIISSETHEKYGEIALDGQVTAILAIRDTMWCALYREGAMTQELRVYDVMTSALLRTVPTPGPARVTAMSRGPAGDVVWTGDASGVICVWGIATGARTATLRRHSGMVTVLAAPARSDQMWSAGADGSLFVWMAGPPFSYVGELRGFHNAPVTDVYGFSDGDEVWSASLDGSVCIWKVDQIPPAFNSLDNIK